jgi:hypothetical protein
VSYPAKAFILDGPLSLGRCQRWSRLSQAYTLDRATIRQNRAKNATGFAFRADVILLLDMLVFKNYFYDLLCLEPFTSGDVMC